MIAILLWTCAIIAALAVIARVSANISDARAAERQRAINEAAKRMLAAHLDAERHRKARQRERRAQRKLAR